MEVCENCGKVIGLKELACLYKTSVVCENCHGVLVAPPASIAVVPETRIVEVSTVKVKPYFGPVCLHCGGAMKYTSSGTNPVLHLLSALIVFGVGIALLFVPCIGWIVGGTLIVVSLVKGSGYKRILMCRNCGAIADRK